MASMLSLRLLPVVPPPPRHSAPFARTKAILKCRNRSVPCSEGTQFDEGPRFYSDQRSGTKRREALLQILLSAVSLPLIATDASAAIDLQENFRAYEDEKNKYRISVPPDWLVGVGDGNDAIKSITAFYPEEASDSNVTIVIAGLGADYTRLESFGTVDAFAESLVTGLDRSWKSPPGIAAKLINSKAANGLYYIEYTLQNPGERCRHILSAIGVASSGWYNRLYTVTGQFMEDESEKYRSQIGKCVSSFKFT